MLLTRIICPNCGHVGYHRRALLPRVLTCSHCRHDALIRHGTPVVNDAEPEPMAQAQLAPI